MDIISAPGFYELDAAAYHADCCIEPSLSSSIARLLVEKTPRHAWSRHVRLNPKADDEASKAMDLGSVAHEIVLGKGGGFAVLDYPAFTTKAAREAREEARAAGLTPILTHAMAEALEIAQAVRLRVMQIDGCERLFQPDHGQAETCMFWQDDGGAWCRTMLDWTDSTGTVVTDLKLTGKGIDDEALRRKISGGDDIQMGFALRGMQILRPEMAGRIRWRWCFVESEPPYECRVVEADNTTMTMGAKRAAYAVELWRQCMASNQWPGYPSRIERLEYSPWAETRWIEREMNDPVAASANTILPSAAPVSNKLVWGDFPVKAEDAA